jgi:hypothetical protein
MQTVLSEFRVRIWDVLVLVAAIAVACLWTRALYPRGWIDVPLDTWVDEDRGMLGILNLVMWMLPDYLLILSATVLIAQLGTNRRQRSQWTQPGTVGCAVAVAVAAFNVAFGAAGRLWRAKQLSDPSTWSVALRAASSRMYVFPMDLWPVGLAVAGAWIALIVVRGWHPNRRPFDLLGQLVCVCWILVYATTHAFNSFASD